MRKSFTSYSSLAQLFVLNETSKHLRVHKELQKLPDSTRRVRFAKGFPLKLLGSIGGLNHVERIVAYQLNEEPNEPLGHQGAQVNLLV